MIRTRVGAGVVEETGQAMVLMAIFMLAMLMIVGLAIDAGQLYVARRTAQEAADAAAFGGAVVLYQTGSTASAVTEARNDAARNGYTNGVNDVTVTVNTPPASGAFAGNALYLEVIITVPVTTSLVPQQAGITNITVRGVGGSAGLNNGYALMVVDQSGSPGTLQVNTGQSINITGTSQGIAVNSSSVNAAQNGGTVTMAPATAQTRVVGGASGTWPNLLTGQSPAPDPYGGFPKPDPTLLPTIASLPAAPGPLNPGVYTVTIAGGAYTMNPGIYIMKGTSVSLTSPTYSLTGTGVMIYMAPSSYPALGGSCGEIRFEGGVNISAPTTGTYKGMLIYQDPGCATIVHLDGNFTSGTLTGTIYVPNAEVEIEISGTTNATQIIAKTIQVESPLTINFASTNTATPLVPALTE